MQVHEQKREMVRRINTLLREGLESKLAERLRDRLINEQGTYRIHNKNMVSTQAENFLKMYRNTPYG